MESRFVLGRSKAGHDKQRVYFVVAEDDSFYYLADGKYKMLSKPKKKNKIHVQPIYRFPSEVNMLIDQMTEPDDQKIRKIIKTYESYVDN